MGSSAVTGGRLVVEALEHEGIRHAFTVPGESFLGILDALSDSSIAVTATRHEGGAAFMAEAYGQYAGRPAACLATRAVGAANLAIGLHTARADSAPLVALVGQAPRAFLGREAFQEIDQVATFGGLCKAAVQPIDIGTLYDEVVQAIRAARSGRPGPVLVALPEDLLDEPVPARAAVPAAGSPGSWTPDRPAAALDDVRAVLRALAGAKRPIVLAGGGVRQSDATAALAAFLDAADVPLVAAWRRTDIHPNDGPRYLGSSGLSAAASVRQRLLEADAIFALGTRLSEVSTFGYAIPGPATTLAQVDIEPGVRGDRRPPDLVVRSDVRRFLDAALALLADRDAARSAGLLPTADLARARAGLLAGDRAAYVAATALPARPTSGPRVHPASVIHALRNLLPPGAIVTTDAGNFAGWAARHLPVPDRGRFLGPTSGAMGYGLPAAIGAAIARRETPEPERLGVVGDQHGSRGGRVPPVVALAGDGGFAMLMAEIETAVREDLRLVAVVFDNAMYGTIRMHQELRYPGRIAATDLGAIDFARVAEACGAQASTVARDADVESALAVALGQPGVNIVHVLTDPRYLSVDRMLQG